MLKTNIVLAALSLLAAAPVLRADQVNAGLSVNSQGGSSFYVDIGNFFQAPPAQVAIVQRPEIPQEEAPVALFLAQQAHVAPDIIVQQRIAGRSWMDIAVGLHLNAATFYLPVASDPGGPYTAIYAHFKGKKSRWKKLRLRDDEIVNLVNLRFSTQHYGYKPQEVGAMRAGGKHFYEFKRHDAAPPQREVRHDRRDDDRHDQHNGY